MSTRYVHVGNSSGETAGSDITGMETTQTVKTMTGPEAATELRVSERQVQRMAQRGKIERVKQGRRYLYRVKTTRPSDVDNVLVLRDTYQKQRRELEELQRAHQGERRRRLRWQVVAIAAAVGALLAGGIVTIGYGLWRGSQANLDDNDRTIARLAEQIRTEQQRGDAARGQVDTVLADLATERDRNVELFERLQRRPEPIEVVGWPWGLAN